MDPTSSAKFGDLLRRYRLAAGLTQEELAERAQVSPRAISDLERGQRNRPWRDTVQLLAQALQLEPAQRAQLEAAARRAGPASPVVTTPRNNLPLQVTSFVGREREIAEVKRLLADTRLLTLAGTGGCGKSRLALRVAADLGGPFADRVIFVPLATMTDPTLAGSAILQAFGVPDTSSRSTPWERLARVLGAERVLLLLDNLEQLPDIGPELARLLERCSGVTVVTTSRARLRVYGEHEYVVPPLATPDPDRVTSLDQLGRNDSVRLFVERAGAVRPDFVLTDANAAAVAGICRRLDGLPLAIELAAARVRLFTPAELLRRLDHRLKLLTDGARDRPARQQTLRATLDWSYDLLTPPEQAVFRQLAVFVGGGTCEAAEAVVDPGGREGPDVLDRIDSLVGQSLLNVSARQGETRFALLETTREYARERLRESGEEEATRARHAAYYFALAELRLRAEEMPSLESDRANLRAALDWFEVRGDVATSARLMEAVGQLWRLQGGPPSEMSGWLARLRALPGFAGASDEVRARALTTEMDLELRRDAVATRACGEQLLALGRAATNRVWVQQALWRLGWSSLELGELSRAEGELADCLAVAREMGNPNAVGNALVLLGDTARLRGQDDLARARYDECRGLSVVGWLSAWQRRNLGFLAVHRGDLAEAEASFREGMAEYGNQRNMLGTIECLVGSAALAAARGKAERGARLLGAVDAALPTIGAKLYPGDRFECERTLHILHATLSENAFAAAWAEGQAMELEEAIAYALETTPE
jgi:predicted ATPase/DNA-binding XRE family transcriptional regulator